VVHALRRKGKPRPRILYWFRTPPGIRVGRGPLDEEAIRLIEDSNPDLEFDWTRILKGQPAPEVRQGERRDQGRDRDRREEPRVRSERRAAVPEPAPPAAPAEEPTTPAHARLGSEGLARLRGRYSEMLARITERIPELEKQDELKTLAERLNPDGWVTDADVTAGLESYEVTFASLRGLLGHRKGPKTGPDPATD
jgi:hypothetical protein